VTISEGRVEGMQCFYLQGQAIKEDVLLGMLDPD